MNHEPKPRSAAGAGRHGAWQAGEFRVFAEREGLAPTDETRRLAGTPDRVVRKWVRPNGDPLWVGEGER